MVLQMGQECGGLFTVIIIIILQLKTKLVLKYENLSIEHFFHVYHMHYTFQHS